MPTDDARPSAAKRGYGYKWQKSSAGYLKSHPWCAEHIKRGLFVDAVIVDHVIPHRGDQQLFWDRSNWQSLCKHCHDSHKQRLEKSGREAGCNVDGIPVDRTHHWNRRGG